MNPLRTIQKTWTSFAWWAKCAILGFAIPIFGVVALDFNLFNLFGPVPSYKSLALTQPEQASFIYAKGGEVLGKYFDENRSSIPFSKMSPNLMKALVATEDVRFYKHNGIDFSSFPGLALDAMKGRSRGGSTITQQLAKNLFKTRRLDKAGLVGRVPVLRTLVAKGKEWILAVKLERTFTKREILAMYLNTVDFGGNTFGINTAAHNFFGVDPSQLDYAQAATLIGMLKAPTYYSPTKYPERSKIRRNVVLSNLRDAGVFTLSQYKSLKNEELALVRREPSKTNEDDLKSYFRQAVEEHLQPWCDSTGYDLYRDGLKIITTLDYRIQSHAEEALLERMKSLQATFNNHWRGQNPWVDDKDKEIPFFIESEAKKTTTYALLSKKYKGDSTQIWSQLNAPHKMKVFSWKGENDTTLSVMDSLRHMKRLLNAGFVAIDPYVGEVRAWVGGINHQFFQYDHVSQAKRQPGSTFKTFAYTAAIAEGYSPCYTFVDKPVTINYVENGEAKSWSPHNADRSFSGGNTTLRRGIGRSINTITAQLTAQVGWDTVAYWAKRLGINSKLAKVPSICLGSSEVNLLELTGAYCTFPNKGIRVSPILVTQIYDRDGRKIATFDAKPTPVMTDEDAFLMMHMLKGTMEEPGGTSQNLWSFDIFRGNEVAGKTGTTSNHADGWYIGITKDLVCGAWVGGDNRSIHFRTSSLGEGSKTALPIYGRFLEKVYQDPLSGITMGYFPKPDFKVKRPYRCASSFIPKKDSTLASPSDSTAQIGT